MDREADATVVVKVQIPLATSVGALKDAPVLVYTRDRAKTWTIPVTQELRAACVGTGKAYYNATVDQRGRLTLLRQIEPQDF